MVFSGFFVCLFVSGNAHFRNNKFQHKCHFLKRFWKNILDGEKYVFNSEEKVFFLQIKVNSNKKIESPLLMPLH